MAEGVRQKSLSSCPQAQAAGFIAGWLFHPGPEAEGSGQATGGQLASFGWCHLCVCPGTAGTVQDRALRRASRPPCGNQLVPCLPAFAVNSSPDKKCHRGRLVSGCPLGQLAGLGPGRTQEAFQDLFVQEAILIFFARAWSWVRLISKMVPPGERRGRLPAARAARALGGGDLQTRLCPTARTRRCQPESPWPQPEPIASCPTPRGHR